MTVESASLHARLEALLGAAAVTVEEVERWAVGGLLPRVVVRPDDAAQVSAVLRACDEIGSAVIPWGGGTAMEVGNPPRAADVVLLTERLSSVVEHDPSNMTVAVQAGMSLAALQRALAEHRQFLPLEPPLAEGATAGGAVALDLGGPRRMRYGGARDLVIGLRAVLAQGATIRAGGKTVKNVAGYDLCRLFVGSLGTLGVLTELTFKVFPLPEVTRTIAAWTPDLTAAMALAGRVLASPLLPSAVTLVRPGRGFAGALEPIGALAEHPGTGRDSRRGTGVLVRAEGTEAAVARHVRDLSAWAADARAEVEVLEGDAEAARWRAVRDFGWDGEGVTVRLAVPPGAVPGVVEDLGRTLPSGAGIAAHPGAGTVWVSADPREVSPVALGALRDLAARHRGNFLLARSPVALRAGRDVWSPEPQALPLMRAVKQAFDPRGTLNPGRFVGGL